MDYMLSRSSYLKKSSFYKQRFKKHTFIKNTFELQMYYDDFSKINYISVWKFRSNSSFLQTYIPFAFEFSIFFWFFLFSIYIEQIRHIIKFMWNIREVTHQVFALFISPLSMVLYLLPLLQYCANAFFCRVYSKKITRKQIKTLFQARKSFLGFLQLCVWFLCLNYGILFSLINNVAFVAFVCSKCLYLMFDLANVMAWKGFTKKI